MFKPSRLQSVFNCHIKEIKTVLKRIRIYKEDKMKTVTVKFVVNDNDEAGLLLNEIAESIGNGTGYPFISSLIENSTEDEIKFFTEVNS